MDVKVDTVKTDRLEMDRCRFGQGKETLVVIPGLSVQSVMPAADAIAEAYKLLTDDFTIYVFDRRKDIPSGYSVQDMADDTAEAMRELGIESASIFGASQGGMIAMITAADHPEMVNKLILGSTSARVSGERFALFEKWIKLAGEGKAEELYLSFGEELYPAEVYESAKEIWIEAAKSVTDEELSRFIIMADAIKGFDLTDKLGSITCPVLVMGSNDDRVLGGGASELIAEGLTGSSDVRIHMYDGYGHAAYDTAPDYTQRMLDFLKND